MRIRSLRPVAIALAGAVALSAGGAEAAHLITGKDIKNGSIGVRDLSKTARRKLRGPRGPRGLRGPAGEKGAQGEPGSSDGSGGSHFLGTGQASSARTQMEPDGTLRKVVDLPPLGEVDAECDRSGSASDTTSKVAFVASTLQSPQAYYRAPDGTTGRAGSNQLLPFPTPGAYGIFELMVSTDDDGSSGPVWQVDLAVSNRSEGDGFCRFVATATRVG